MELEPKPAFIILDNIDDILWNVNIDYFFEINSDFKKRAHMKRWCEQNCLDTVAYYMPYGNKVGFSENEVILNDRIYFFRQEDMLAFKLQWDDAIIA